MEIVVKKQLSVLIRSQFVQRVCWRETKLNPCSSISPRNIVLQLEFSLENDIVLH